ncbi:Uncharacterised protein [Mycobacterium tuberculosis]|nr:Uncharacterised protein [Mycobacterium tuberculosis]
MIIPRRLFQSCWLSCNGPPPSALRWSMPNTRTVSYCPTLSACNARFSAVAPLEQALSTL